MRCDTMLVNILVQLFTGYWLTIIAKHHPNQPVSLSLKEGVHQINFYLLQTKFGAR